jgi:uncharacterized protein HemY
LLSAQERFVQASQLESTVDALIAAEASEKLGDHPKREQFLEQAKSNLSRLQQAWGNEIFKAYVSRPDIQLWQKQVG